MRLASRLILIILLAFLIVLATDAFLFVRRQESLYASDAERTARSIGLAARRSVEAAWRAGGETAALGLIEELNHAISPTRLRWVWLAGRSEGEPAQAPTTTRSAEAKDQLIAVVPVDISGERPGGLEVTEKVAAIRRFERHTIQRVAAISGILLVISAITVVAAGISMIGMPLGRLIEKTRRVARGDFSGADDIRAKAEIRELGDAMNTMCRRLAEAERTARQETESRIAAIEKLRHADRLTTVGRLASGMAHELGTPLNVVAGRAQLIASESLSAAQVKESAEVIVSQSERMTGLVRNLLQFARHKVQKKSDVDLAWLARETLDLVSPVFDRVETRLDCPENPSESTVTADQEQIRQVLTNLVVNGMQAMPEGGVLQVRIAWLRARPAGDPEGPEREHVSVSISDQGTGIAADDMPRLFDPFFTTKDLSEGTGLGLSIAHGIVAEHDGWIDVQTTKGSGTCFTVILPREAS